jgi:dihydroorotase
VKPSLLIRNARHWRTGAEIDVAVADGVIVVPTAPAEREIDARGAVLSPGLVDVHVHLREPGQSAKETLASGTMAAAAGGFTDVACMPNTDPVLDEVARIEWVSSRARKLGRCRVHPIAAVTRAQKGEELTEFVALEQAGAVALSDDGHPIASAVVMRRALEYARHTALPIICHEEDPSLRGEGQMNEGPTATRLGIRGIPAAAETVMVRRDVELAELTGGRIHLAHLSCAGALEAVRDAKRRRLAVTAETCPHYWTLTEEAVGEYVTHAKMNPPLRSAEDRAAVIAGVADGTIDCLATDHAPHTEDEKRQTFDRAPFGIVGLETALALTITFLVEPGHVTLERALALWTEAPRRILGLPRVGLEIGDPADLVLIDPAAPWTVDAGAFHSKGRNTPFDGWRLLGKVLATVCGGSITYLGPELETADGLPGALAGTRTGL